MFSQAVDQISISDSIPADDIIPALLIKTWDNGDKNLAQQVYRQAINLDARYTQITFLNHLTKGSFYPRAS